MNQSIADLAALAAQDEDQTETVVYKDFEPAAAGPAVCRFIEYIELGKQPQRPYMGKDKPPADEVLLTFELLTPKHIHKYTDADGTERTRADRITVTMTKKLGDKAGYKKLFDKMRYGRDAITHMAQMLGEPFKCTVVHNVTEKEGKSRTYANLWPKGGEPTLGVAKYQKDPLVDTFDDIPVQPALSPLRIFLVNRPNKATWDSLFIDGTRTVKSGDIEVQQSKNWLQEKIMHGTTYTGSALEAMLVGDIPELGKPADTVQPVSTVPTVEAVAAPVAQAATSAQAAVDPLAALGLK
jgi:hypothetical protein